MMEVNDHLVIIKVTLKHRSIQDKVFNKCKVSKGLILHLHPLLYNLCWHSFGVIQIASPWCKFKSGGGDCHRLLKVPSVWKEMQKLYLLKFLENISISIYIYVYIYIWSKNSFRRSNERKQTKERKNLKKIRRSTNIKNTIVKIISVRYSHQKPIQITFLLPKKMWKP